MTILLAAAVGLAVGVVVGMLGAGGGVLSMPILVYLLGVEPHAAAASSLVIVGLSSGVSMIPHARRGNVGWRDGIYFGVLGIVATVVGSRLTASVAPELLMTSFAVMLAGVAALMLRRAVRARRRSPGPQLPASTAASDPAPPVVKEDVRAQEVRPGRVRRLATLVVAASVAGLLTGFFGVGGGFIVVPALVMALGVGMRYAVGTSLLVVLLNSVAGLLARIGEPVTIDWPVVLAFAAGSMVAGLLGARLSARARPATLTLLFGILLAVVALVTAVQAVPALLG